MFPQQQEINMTVKSNFDISVKGPSSCYQHYKGVTANYSGRKAEQ